jgi:hypothetical protein
LQESRRREGLFLATWFNETTNAELRGWKGSEHELVSRACRLSGFTPDRIVHQTNA